MNKFRQSSLSVVPLLGLLFVLSRAAESQAVTPVPNLAFDRYLGAWHEVARLPNKRERNCISDVTVLYALGDKPRQFQMVTSCRLKKTGELEAWNSSGKSDPSGDGKLQLTTIWPFSAKYWVLAVGPGYEWMLIGDPSRKSLWVLSKTPVVNSEVFAEIKLRAAAEGFDMTRLEITSQMGTNSTPSFSSGVVGDD